MKFFGLLIVPVLFAARPGFAQSDIQKMLNSAKAVKNSSPPQKTPARPELPAGYDNSWKVMVSLSRTVRGTTDLISVTNQKCETTKKGSYTLTLTADFSSDHNLGWIFEDDFTVNSYRNVDNEYKSFVKPLTGSYTISSTGNETDGSCGDYTYTESAVNGNADLKELELSFAYDKKLKQGNFAINPLTTNVNASGKITHRSKNGSQTIDGAPAAKAMFDLMFAVCGQMASRNYAVSQDAKIQEALNASPVNGGFASIGLTKYGYDINYAESKTVDDVPSGWKGVSRITYTTSIHILITNQDPPQYDAIIEIAKVPLTSNYATDYAKWVPEGPPPPVKNQPDNTLDKGNSIAFDVYLVDRKKPDQRVTGINYDVDYKLSDVSIEPGYCLNYPMNAADNGKKDLRFDETLKNASNTVYDQEELKSTDYHGQSCIGIITSYDYGSFGKLTATVTLDNGMQIPAHFKDDKKLVIPLPKDDNNNQIADEWEIEKNIYDKNYSPFWDGEKQKLGSDVVNDNDGDGLALYEEYRGLIVKGQHLRLDPDKKELFVLNQIGDQAEAGIDLFKKASGISVVELTDQEIDKYDLVVNGNSIYAKGGKQHGLLLKNYQTSNSNTQGLTPRRDGGDDPPSSPADCSYVGINLAYPFKDDDLAVTIAHEMAHGCGVWHHGGLNTVDPPGKGSIDNTYKFYASDMSMAAPESIAAIEKDGLLGMIAGPGGQSSGDMHCIMCYEDQYVWAAPLGKDGKVFINVDHADHCSKSLFCNSAGGTYMNAKPSGKRLYSVYGDASKGDCIHQFKIKDW